MSRSRLMLWSGTATALLFFALPSGALDPSDFPPPGVRLTGDLAGSTRPGIAFDPDGNLAVVWQDTRSGNAEILWQKFDLWGQPLTGVTRLTTTSSSSVRPQVSCDASANSHIVWQEGEANGVGTVYLGCLDLDGIKARADAEVLGLSGHAQVAALAGGEADVVWYRRSAADHDVYYRRYSWGRSYSCQRRFNAGSMYAMEKDPAVAVSGIAQASILWSDMNGSFQYKLMEAAVDYLCGSSSGAAYANHVYSPDIDIAGTRMERVFQFGNRIYRLAPGGEICQISAASSGCSLPSVGTSQDASYVVWQDSRNGNADVYIRQYLDCAGLTADLPVTQTPNASSNPSIAVNHGGSGDWAVVWQEDLGEGNTEIYLTSSRLLGASQSFVIAGATFDKQVYFNGNDVATIRVVTQSVTGNSTALSLDAVLTTNLGDFFLIGTDDFSLSTNGSHVSTFQWSVPVGDRPWDFSLDLTLRDGGSSVASAHLNKVAMGTNLSQVEIDAIIDEITSCSPLMDGCLMYAVGLVPGFGLPTQLVSFQNAVCKMNYHWERGNAWKAGGALFRALLAPLGTAVGAAYGAGSPQDLLVRGGRAVQNCGTDMLNALFNSRSSAIDSLAAETAASMEFEYSAEIFAEGDVTLRVGVENCWTSEDTLSINEAVVFPVFAGDLRWAHVGPEPAPIGTSGGNPHSAFETELAARGAGPVEFGLLKFVPPDTSAWIRFKTIPMDENSVARISTSDTTTALELYLDRDGDGMDDEIWHTDGTMETIHQTGAPGNPTSRNFLTASPNPMMGGTTLRYGLHKAGSVELVVYDLTGRRRANLLIGSVGDEVQSLTWNGTDDNGRQLPAGVYLVRLTTDTGVMTRKIVLTR